MAATSTVVKNLNDGYCILKDGTAVTPLECAVDFELGTIQITGLKRKNRTTNAYQGRGDLKSLRHTERVFPGLTFTAMMAALSYDAADPNNPADIILAQAYYAAAVSTYGADADVYTLLVTIGGEGTDHGDASDWEATLDDVELAIDFGEGDPNTWTMTGTVYGDLGGDLAGSTY